MSGPEPPELGLEAARERLARKGYLQAALPAPPPGRGRAWLHGAAIAAVAALVAAWAAVSAAGLAAGGVLPLAAGLFLPVLLVAGAATAMATPLTRLGLRAGLGPAAVAGACGVAAGAGVVGLVALATGVDPVDPAALALPWLAGAALAVEATWAARTAVLRRVSLDSVAAPRPRGLLVALATVAAVALLVAMPRILARRAAPPPPAPNFPRVDGRLAVVAVDGLAREDLDAFATADDPAWAGLPAWGWVPLQGSLPPLPAVLWSTVATGVGPQRHGVVVLDEVRLFGSSRGVPLDGPLRTVLLASWGPVGLARVVARPSLQRSAPTFWEMASRAGVPVTVGGWWGSWPVRRLLGEVASERAWLSGSTTADAVTAGLAETVAAAWSGQVGAAAAADRLALALAARAAVQPSPHLVALWLPGLDLVRRAAPPGPALALAARSAPHLAALRELVARLRAGGYDVWVVAVPWAGGTPFAASSAAARGEHPAIDPRALAATWLDQLGLPQPLGVEPPRRDLTASAPPTLTEASYGPPPPPLSAPPRAALEVQREVLRSLGYLR